MAAAKTLEKGSQFEKFDTDGDGVVTDAEMAQMERMLKIENDDKKEDQIRAMVAAFFGAQAYTKTRSSEEDY
jgi:Ca2+-binding EF-hand superfamily protein